MGKEKKQLSRAWKTVILVLITLVVFGSVFLTVYLVNKHNPEGDKAENTFVGYANSTDFGAFTVTGRKLQDSINGKTAKEGNVFFVISIDYEARDKDITIKRSNFNFSGYKAEKEEGYLKDSVKLNKGEKTSIKVAFEVPKANKELFLYCYGYRVKMGNSIEYVPIA